MTESYKVSVKTWLKKIEESQGQVNAWKLILLCLTISLIISFLLLTYNNPVPLSSPSFVLVVKRRWMGILSMLIAAICQGMATIAFQSITANRIITPSLLGFEAVYGLIQTLAIVILGTSQIITLPTGFIFLFEVILMVLLSLLLYSTLLTKHFKNIHWMLLVGIILGSVLRSFSSFLRKWLTPTDYDILQAKLMLSVNHADPEIIPFAVLLTVITALVLWKMSHKLNVLALGRQIATTLGLSYQKHLILVLIYVAILMSVSTALVGPISFLGFLAAALTYQWVDTYDHHFLLPLASLFAYIILAGSYFILYHVLNTQGSVAIIIEFLGGIFFLFVLIRRGKL